MCVSLLMGETLRAAQSKGRFSYTCFITLHLSAQTFPSLLKVKDIKESDFELEYLTLTKTKQLFQDLKRLKHFPDSLFSFDCVERHCRWRVCNISCMSGWLHTWFMLFKNGKIVQCKCSSFAMFSNVFFFFPFMISYWPMWWTRQKSLVSREKHMQYNFVNSAFEYVLTSVKSSHFNFPHSEFGSKALQKCWDELFSLINNAVI